MATAAAYSPTDGDVVSVANRVLDLLLAEPHSQLVMEAALDVAKRLLPYRVRAVSRARYAAAHAKAGQPAASPPEDDPNR